MGRFCPEPFEMMSCLQTLWSVYFGFHIREVRLFADKLNSNPPGVHYFITQTEQITHADLNGYK